ncbi:MAG: FAD:protein FMN transferase [Neomegalonema sp.]|nr:FAD:protein FMN transferase [Neomegalonema sp.]
MMKPARLSRRRMIMLSAAAIGASRMPARAEDRTLWRGQALGAEASLTLLGGDRAAADAAILAVRAMLARVEALFSLHRGDSALVRLNREGALRAPDPLFTRTLDLAIEIAKASGGAFDPTVQPLWQALARGADIEAARALVDYRRITRGEDRITLAPGTALTLNGIAQGIASDEAAVILSAHGYRASLAHIGEFAAQAPKPDGTGWRIGVAEPQSAQIRHVLALESGGIATSEPNAMRLGEHGQSGHILTPSGQGPHWASVTVEASSAARADALSTAIAAAAPEQAEPILRQGKGRRAVLIAPSGALTILR